MVEKLFRLATIIKMAGKISPLLLIQEDLNAHFEAIKGLINESTVEVRLYFGESFDSTRCLYHLNFWYICLKGLELKLQPDVKLICKNQNPIRRETGGFTMIGMTEFKNDLL